MSAWTEPVTRVGGMTASASEMNAFMRDNQRHIHAELFLPGFVTGHVTGGAGTRAPINQGSYSALMSARIDLYRKSNVLMMADFIISGGRTGWNQNSNEYGIRTGNGSWVDVGRNFGATGQLSQFIPRVLTGLPSGQTWVTLGMKRTWSNATTTVVNMRTILLEQLPVSG